MDQREAHSHTSKHQSTYKSTNTPTNKNSPIPSSNNHPQTHPPSTLACQNGWYKCKEAHCIPNSYVCDGNHDCPLGNDEEKGMCKESW